MKAKLLRKIRQEWSIEYCPNGFHSARFEGMVYEPSVVLRKTNFWGNVVFEKFNRAYGHPSKVAQTAGEIGRLKDAMMEEIKIEYHHLPTAKKKRQELKLAKNEIIWP